MFRIRRFGVVRTATVVAVAYAIVFAIIFIPFLLLGAAVVPGEVGGFAMAGFLMMAVILLVVYPLLIWVFTALACLVYNLAARMVGGIEVEIERFAPAGSQPYGYPYGPPPGQGTWGGPGGPPPAQAPWSGPTGPSGPPSGSAPWSDPTGPTGPAR